MKRFIQFLLINVLVLIFHFSYADCKVDYHFNGVCHETWCFNAGANTQVSCTCGAPIIIDCGGPQQ